MTKKSWILAVVVVFAIAVVGAVPASADVCSWECFTWSPDGSCSEPLVWMCYPEYDVWQSIEPDWCLYQHGDEVQLQYGTVNGVFQPVGWYVTATNGSLGAEHANGMVTDCAVFWYPW